MDIDFIREKVRKKQYVIDPDHLLILRKYDVSLRNLEKVILTGEIIETYPRDLILGYMSNGLPLHVACDYWKERDSLYLRTVYIPDDRWEKDHRTRKKRRKR